MPPMSEEDKQPISMSSIPGMVAPGDPGRTEGLGVAFVHLEQVGLGRMCRGSYWYPTEDPGDEVVRGKVACGTSTR